MIIIIFQIVNMARKGSISSLLSTQPGSFLEFADSTPNSNLNPTLTPNSNLNPTLTPNSNLNPTSNFNTSSKEKNEYRRLRKTVSPNSKI